MTTDKPAPDRGRTGQEWAFAQGQREQALPKRPPRRCYLIPRAEEPPPSGAPVSPEAAQP